MDISEHISSGFLKPADLGNETKRAVIANVTQGRYEKPDMEFQDGYKLGLNATNIRVCAQAWGKETNEWIGHEVELYVGETEYQGRRQDSVLIRIPRSQGPRPLTRPPASTRKDLDDEIPF